MKDNLRFHMVKYLELLQIEINQYENTLAVSKFAPLSSKKKVMKAVLEEKKKTYTEILKRLEMSKSNEG